MAYEPQTPADFRDFLHLVWEHLSLPAPTPIQLDLARWLADPACPRRFILEAFRGVGKSWITVAFVLWILDHHPNWNILVVSASKAAADEFSNFCFQLIREMPCLLHLTPRDGQRDSKISFDVGPAPAAKAPSVKSLGITSQLTGSRADVIIADDIEVPSNSLTQGMRDKLAEQVKEFDAIVKPGGRIVFLGTPQCEQSIYNTLQEKHDAEGKSLFVTRIWPARYPDTEECKEYGSRLAPYITRALAAAAGAGLVGQPTDPRRFSDVDLRERAISYGRAGFALQFQLRTKLSDHERYPLKVHDLICMNLDPEKAPQKLYWGNGPTNRLEPCTNVAMPGDFFYRPIKIEEGEWLPYQGSVMIIDPSGRGKDETGYAIVKMLNSVMYLVAAGGFSGGYDQTTLKALALLAAAHQVNAIQIEANFGDGMYTELFKPVLAEIPYSRIDIQTGKLITTKGYPVSIEEVKHSIQKEKRICDTLEPVISGHRLVIDPLVIEADYSSLKAYPTETAYQYSLIYQMTRITREKGCLAHDDRLDALAMAVSYWTEQLAKSTDESVEDRKAELLDEALQKFMEDFASTGASSNRNHRTTREKLWSPHMR